MNEDNTDIIIDETLKNFYQDLLDNQEDLPPEFQKVIDDNYWDLITDTSGKIK